MAFADELLERPELLVEYTEHHKPGEDATLVIWGTRGKARRVRIKEEGVLAPDLRLNARFGRWGLDLKSESGQVFSDRQSDAAFSPL